jgi:hypothetical protein
VAPDYILTNSISEHLPLCSFQKQRPKHVPWPQIASHDFLGASPYMNLDFLEKQRLQKEFFQKKLDKKHAFRKVREKSFPFTFFLDQSDFKDAVESQIRTVN